MSLISFAQNQEDVILWRALHPVEQGFYIDLGIRPVPFSVTRLFYEQGWSGINLATDPASSVQLDRDRPRDINLATSIPDAAIAGQAFSFAAICQRHRPEGPIHFLRVDSQGLPRLAFAEADFVTFRPWIIVAQAQPAETGDVLLSQWEPMLTRQGYSFSWFDGMNRFYLAAEKQSELAPFFQQQPNILEPFSPAGRNYEMASHDRRRDAVLRQTIEGLARQARLTQQAGERCEAVLAQLASERERHADAIARVSADAAAKAAELANAQASAAALELWLAAMTASTSWRLTAPIRWLGNLLCNAGRPRLPGIAVPPASDAGADDAAANVSSANADPSPTQSRAISGLSEIEARVSRQIACHIPRPGSSIES